ncbi:MAG: hypothetical protein LUF82_04795 [Clostridia bacterium]|nr:hypothetical protein [Clostridia bacterium]
MVTTLILSLVLMAAMFCMIWAAVALIQKKKFYSSAPKDIQDAIIERSERFRGARLIGYAIAFLCIAVFPAVFIFAGWDGVRQGYNFWMFFGRYIAILYLLKVFDIIFLDWFLLTKSHFYQHYASETEGCEGYHQFGFNKKQHIIHIIIFPFIALIAAGICTLFI